MPVLTSQGRTKVSPGLPIGAVVAFYDPDGEGIPDGWSLCDGTGGTPDLRDRFIIGDTVAGTGSAVGSTSPVAALTHTGGDAANHSNHAVTQPGAHSNHAVTQPSDHAAHTVTQPNAHGTHSSDGAHTHDSHTSATTTAGINADTASPVTHNSQGGHTHDAHSAHAGMAVDAHSVHSGMTVDAHSAHSGSAVDPHSAHSVTQASAHAILKHYELAYVMRVS